MRPSVFLAAIPFALGCAQQSVVRAPSLPSDEPLKVRLYQPTAGNLNYELSEPAYVAIFAISRGQGISLIFPHFESQVDRPSHAGLNQETVHGGSTRGGYASRAGYGHGELFGHADAYYIVASKYPMPVEGMVQSPFLLRSLVGADVFRATNFNDTWDALESILVAGLPDDAWASDVYLTWRSPFATASWQPERFLQYCGNGIGFFSISLLDFGACDRARRTDSSPTPVPVATLPRRTPPQEPLDRDPTVPLPPDAQIARTFRASEAIRHEGSRRDTDSNRGESGRASERNRIESVRAPERESVRREPPAPAPAPSPPPARAPESRPQPEPSPKSPLPQPDP